MRFQMNSRATTSQKTVQEIDVSYVFSEQSWHELLILVKQEIIKVCVERRNELVNDKNNENRTD